MNLVRTHFQLENDRDLVVLEEQGSENLKITKLLKNASKKGPGLGRPDFLLTFKNEPDFLVVIECKAETSKHESALRDRHDDYAVDGVLLYASFLAKEFDVLAIAVSGETLASLKVSHFLQLKN